VKAKGFGELKGLKEQLAQAALEQAKAAAIAKEKAERLAREVSVFRDAMTGTEPLRSKARVDVAPPKPEPIAFQFQRDEQAALWQTLSDDMDIERLLDTDANLSFRRAGIGEDVTRKLRKGHWAVQDQIDLHGLRTDEAREALGGFFSNSHKRELRCLRIIHGKGLGSINKTPVLKDKVLRWLVQREEVIAFCQARPNDGGAGALIVLLGRVG
jgi:DNA-nicking Smr family endonuclease